MQRVNALLLVKADVKEEEHILLNTDANGKTHKKKVKATRVEFPRVPGMGVRALAQNPEKPNEEQLWLVEAPRAVIVALSGEENVEWLSLDMAEATLEEWGVGMALRDELLAKNIVLAEPRG